VAIGVDNVEQLDNVGILHFFEEGDFADGGRGNAFVFGLEADLLEGNDLLILGGEIAGFVDDSIGACREGALLASRQKLHQGPLFS
jgi:hypothetical protein